jgi:hypothetical protein
VIDHEFAALPSRIRTDIVARRDAYEDLWRTALAQGVETGEFVDRGGVARLALIEMCTGVAHWYKPRGALTIPELCTRFGDMALALAGAHRDGRVVTVAELDVPDPERYLALVDIPSEPRRQPARR